MAAEQVGLGIADQIDDEELFKLQSHYFPVGKIGGKPAWLDPVRVPKAEDLKCGVCGKSMAFVTQLYASGASEPEHAFHRYIYVFVCRNGECSKANQSDNLRVLRSQLPLKNDYYSDKPLDKFVPVDPKTTFDNGETAATLCNTCGISASSKCAKCQKVWYCSKDHQLVDWKSGGHKKKCGKLATEQDDSVVEDESKVFSTSNKTARSLNAFLFREFGLELIVGYVGKADLFEFADAKNGSGDQQMNEDDSEDDSMDEDEEENEEFEREQQDELDKLVEKLKIDGLDSSATAELSDTMRNERRDRYFQRFSRIVDRNSEQVMRYARHEKPLRPSDHVNFNENIPKCACGAERTFEFQLMPHLLSLMDVDTVGSSIDWATVCIYTCSASCSTLDKGFAHEFVTKHDFSTDQQRAEAAGQ